MATVALSTPVTHADKTISELTFREASFGDMCAADSFTGENSKTAAVLASMSGVPIQVIKGLKMRDMTAVLAAASPLMGNDDSTPTGAV